MESGFGLEWSVVGGAGRHDVRVFSARGGWGEGPDGGMISESGRCGRTFSSKDVRRGEGDRE